MMGIALFPIVMLRCYFNLPMQTTMICVIILLILVNLLVILILTQKKLILWIIQPLIKILWNKIKKH